LVSDKTEKPVLLVGKVYKTLNPSRYSEKYILELERLDSFEVEGRVLLNVNKDSISKELNVDDKVVLKTVLVPINSPKNPHQFDYSDFMKNRGVFRQIYAAPNEILVFKAPKNSLFGHAEKTREKISFALRENGLSENNLAMVQGLMLGQTDDISDEIYDDYAAAGVIHILSVSGLHVGFVLLIFNFLLKPLEFNRFGKILKVVLLITLLWGFALLAGFSSPVVRSVAMFSLVAIGLNWKRKTNLINILFMSMLLILLFEPRFVFEIGFQLSYLAVFAIVALQPVFYKLYASQNKIVKYILGTISVTISAQIGVTALGLYYFHQFPGISVFSNILVIPFTGIILGLGMLVITLAFLKILPGFLVDLLGWSIEILNQFVSWCADQEAFLFQNISFSFWEMLVAYLFVFCFILAMWKFNFKRLAACLVAVIVFLGISLYQKNKVYASNEFLIFHKNRKSMLGFKTGKSLMVSHNLPPENIAEEYSIRNYAIGEAVDEISSDLLNNIYKIDGENLLVVDSSGIYELPELQNSLVLLRNSPQINLERLIETLHPKTIIADGSNYHSYVARWRKTCAETGIPFHWTKENGVFVVEY
jgi:competence protein ComEC